MKDLTIKLSRPLPIYHICPKDRFRYSLGEYTGVKSTLFVFGVNPSKATNTHLDPTLTNVSSFTKVLGYKSFIMLNIYPQRATDPANIHKRANKDHFEENHRIISELIPRNGHAWAAWGNLVGTRPYFYKTLLFLENLQKEKSLKWINYGKLTKQGHPPHPSRKKICKDFRPFDLPKYLKTNW